MTSKDGEACGEHVMIAVWVQFLLSMAASLQRVLDSLEYQLPVMGLDHLKRID